MLYNKISEDWKAALKAGLSEKVLLSSIVAELKNKAIALNIDRTKISDELCLEVLGKMAKQRTDNAGAYRIHGAEDMAKAEEFEVAVIERYLPPKMSVELVGQMIEEIIATVGATSEKDVGKVMKVLSPKIKGTFDGKQAMELVKARLAG